MTPEERLQLDYGTGSSGTRHKVVGLTFVLGFVLYLDRAAVSVLSPAIRKDLHFGPMALGTVFMAFVWGYALFNVPSGLLGDRFGARRVLAAIVVLWSGLTAATSAAWNLPSLLAIRFVFGSAEAGATPNVSQSFARWIPIAERARAQGFYLAGMDAGLGLTAPLITIGLLHFGWRSTFVGLGFAGLLWAAVWYLWYRDDPAQHRGVNAGELAIMGEAAARQQGNAVQWTEVVASPNLWAILLMYLTYGYTGYIYVTWFPTYLIEARHVSTGLAGILAAMPGLLGLVTKPLGGWMSDRLTQRYGLTFGRRSVGILGFGVAALAVLPGLYVNSNYWSAFFLAIASAAAALAHGVCFAVCIDIGRRRAGTISGLMLTCGCVGNAASAFAFGFFLQFTGSWTAPFLIGMGANLTGALLWLKIHPEEQIA